MAERDTQRTNAEARADVAARGPRATHDSALLRYLAADAHRAAGIDKEQDEVNEEAVHEHQTTAGESGPEHR